MHADAKTGTALFVSTLGQDLSYVNMCLSFRDGSTTFQE